jgi:acyl carrier protein
MDWSRALAQFAGDPPPLLLELAAGVVTAPRNAGSPAPDALVVALAAAPPEEHLAVTIAHVGEQLVRVFGLEPGTTVDRDHDLGDLGMDSLMAVELTNRLRASTGLALETTLAFDHPTVRLIAEHLNEQLARVVEVRARLAAMSPDDVARALAARRALGKDGTS